jgi:hypothetical protein
MNKIIILLAFVIFGCEIQDAPPKKAASKPTRTAWESEVLKVVSRVTNKDTTNATVFAWPEWQNQATLDSLTKGIWEQKDHFYFSSTGWLRVSKETSKVSGGAVTERYVIGSFIEDRDNGYLFIACAFSGSWQYEPCLTGRSYGRWIKVTLPPKTEEKKNN